MTHTALLIAGAVLLVIALIAVGMGIFGTARGVVNQAQGQIDNMSIQMHNRQFEPYEGVGKTYGEIKECLTAIVSNNDSATLDAFKITLKNLPIPRPGGFSGTKLANSEINELDDIPMYLNDFVSSWKEYKNETYKIRFTYSEEGIIDGCIIEV